MKFIIDLGLVRDRLSLDNRAEVNAVLESALSGAVANVESVLDSSFSWSRRVDYHAVNGGFSTKNGVVSLRMSSGMVSSSADYLPKVSSAESMFGPLESVITGVWDYERGTFSYPDTQQHKFVASEYYSGFLDKKQVPSWLQEVLITETVKVLSMQAVNDRPPELDKVSQYINRHAATILDRHLRVGSFLINSAGTQFLAL